MPTEAAARNRFALLERMFRHFRTRRMKLFEETFGITNATRVLDVGGSEDIWNFASIRPRLTIVNLPSALRTDAKYVHRVGADGRLLPFRDGCFDVVFSNSVIEHVGTTADQNRFAAEIMRVGRRFWVQTPNRLFPVEMHVILPLVHRMPKAIETAVVTRFTVWELLTRPTEEMRRAYINHVVEELNLLDRATLVRLFPGARVRAERFLGMEKSLIAYKT